MNPKNGAIHTYTNINFEKLKQNKCRKTKNGCIETS
jgi:hypothetical protein